VNGFKEYIYVFEEYINRYLRSIYLDRLLQRLL